MPIRKWNEQLIIDAALDRSEQRMGVATILVQNEVKRKLNRSNKRGKEPSAPGEPPRKGRGDLQSSIFQEVRRKGKEVIGVIGSRLLRARRLELGFMGKDRLGRTVNQAPRPFLRPTLLELRDRLKKILGAK